MIIEEFKILTPREIGSSISEEDKQIIRELLYKINMKIVESLEIPIECWLPYYPPPRIKILLEKKFKEAGWNAKFECEDRPCGGSKVTLTEI